MEDIEGTKIFGEIEAPWSDRVRDGEDPDIYFERNYRSIILLLIYNFFIAIALTFIFIRYEPDDWFWTVFIGAIIWIAFGSVSIWYGTLHGDYALGIFLMIVFIAIYIGYLYITLESHHQNKIKAMGFK